MTTQNGSLNGTKPAAPANNTTKAGQTNLNKPNNKEPETPVDAPKESPKPELSSTVISAPAKIPSIQQRIEKFHQLEKVLERHDKITEAVKQLNDFYIAPSGNGCNLKLTDSRNNSFAISHPSVIGEIVAMAKGKFNDELKSIEADFDFEIK